MNKLCKLTVDGTTGPGLEGMNLEFWKSTAAGNLSDTLSVKAEGQAQMMVTQWVRKGKEQEMGVNGGKECGWSEGGNTRRPDTASCHGGQIKHKKIQ